MDVYFSGQPKIKVSAFQSILESRSGAAMGLPVSVVAISGKARTGKSFFSNLEIRFLKNVEEVLDFYCYKCHIYLPKLGFYGIICILYMYAEFKRNFAHFTLLLACKELAMRHENTSVNFSTSAD